MYSSVSTCKDHANPTTKEDGKSGTRASTYIPQVCTLHIPELEPPIHFPVFGLQPLPLKLSLVMCSDHKYTLVRYPYTLRIHMSTPIKYFLYICCKGGGGRGEALGRKSNIFVPMIC